MLALALLLPALPAPASALLPLHPRHDDEPTAHSSPHAAPLLQLNESQILQGHAPDPPSYWVHDYDSAAPNARGLMTLHVTGMLLAFFVFLPVAISLRSTKHPWRKVAQASFGLTAFLSAAAGSLYKKITGDLYEGSVHGTHGYLALGLFAVLATFDAFAFLRRAYAFLRSPDKRNIRLFWRTVVWNRDDGASSFEYTHLFQNETDDYVESKLDYLDQQHRGPSPLNTQFSRDHRTSEWANQEWSHTPHSAIDTHRPCHSPRNSSASDDTLHAPLASPIEQHESSSDTQDPSTTRSQTFRRILIATVERLLVVLGFMQLLSGITVYTGMCRGNYINGCMAHLIKGGIFWCYGILSFGRYLGAWADLGWAWNRLPSRRARNIPSAEMVESFVVFLYGATNTWMERFGAAPGSPYTTKQIQHISIAVMFWFAGLLGMALESKMFRRWLASPAYSAVRANESVAQPPSYAGSFNPFPALVIGVTGAAMSAHHQTYMFQVQIHALWGFFLTAFAVLRFLTYFFLWLRPPHSVLPSRPPTEALASFCLASGGLAFVLSTEQITYAAMRHGHDDVMFFFNFAVAVTSLEFCWLLAITAFKGWLSARSRGPSAAPSSSRQQQQHSGSRRVVVFDADAQVA